MSVIHQESLSETRNGLDLDLVLCDHFLASRLSPLEGYEPPLINSPCLQYKFILVWRGFTKTVPCIHFFHSIDDETLLVISAVIKHLRVFWRPIRPQKWLQWPLITLFCIDSLRWKIFEQNDMSSAIFYCQEPEINSDEQNLTLLDRPFFGPD